MNQNKNMPGRDFYYIPSDLLSFPTAIIKAMMLFV